MRIHIVSDLHVDLDYGTRLSLPGGDLLLNIGDLGEVQSLAKPLTLTNINKEFDKYARVVSVMGNHEYWGYDLNTTAALYKATLPKVTLLEKQWMPLSDSCMVFGATLWPDLSGDPVGQVASHSWSDYQRIQVGERLLNSCDTDYEHDRTISALLSGLEEYPDKNIIIATHFAPSSASVPPQYRMSVNNRFFHADLEDIILDNPNIKLWAHGHMHNFCDYKIGDCRVVCNPRGYVTPYRTEGYGFNPNFSVEV